MMMDDSQLKFLLELLDDENDRSANLVMAELLRTDQNDLDRCLSSLQKSDNPRLKRRVHQLESAIRARKKRTLLEQKLKRPADSRFPLLEAALQFHLAWFDNDKSKTVLAQWNELLTELKVKKGPAPTLRDVADFLKQRGFSAPLNDDLAADFYCFGVVIDEKYGSDILLSLIAVELLRQTGKNAAIVRYADDYGVSDLNGNWVFPAYDWEFNLQRDPAAQDRDFEQVPDLSVIRFIGAMLFVCAVGSDSFRYVYTISEILASLCGNHNIPQSLPYPYTIGESLEK